MAVPVTDLIQWLGYGLYLLGAVLLWVYSRDQRTLSDRVTKVEDTRPTFDDTRNIVKSILYDDTTRP